MLVHSLIHFEMQKNDVSEPKFIGVCSRSHLPKGWAIRNKS